MPLGLDHARRPEENEQWPLAAIIGFRRVPDRQ